MQNKKGIIFIFPCFVILNVFSDFIHLIYSSDIFHLCALWILQYFLSNTVKKNSDCCNENHVSKSPGPVLSTVHDMVLLMIKTVISLHGCLEYLILVIQP